MPREHIFTCDLSTPKDKKLCWGQQDDSLGKTAWPPELGPQTNYGRGEPTPQSCPPASAHYTK